MNIESVKLVYFSPTGTTKAVLQGIARGMDAESAEFLDITLPDSRIQPLQTSEKELLIVGVPVYLGRVPANAFEWLHTLKAENTPAVSVVVYGNRAYDDALLELKDILTECGCKPIAGAAFIGEHSFTTDETTATGRPDTADIQHAELFGRKIQEKIRAIPSPSHIPEVIVPGCHPYQYETCHPYQRDSIFWNVDFISVSDACVQCGICADGCPVGAINSKDSRAIDTEKCITCCACIKNCPTKARILKPGMVMNASLRIATLYKERKEPEYFL